MVALCDLNDAMQPSNQMGDFSSTSKMSNVIHLLHIIVTKRYDIFA